MVDLLLSRDDMPPGWEVLERSDGYFGDQGQIDGAYVIFFYFQSGYLIRAEEDIFRYDSRGSAGWHYDRFERIHLNEDQATLTTSWSTPSEFDFISEAADQWRFECAGSTFHPLLEPIDSHTQCIYLAQYQEYLVFFSVTTTVNEEELVPIRELNETIKNLDNRMGSRFTFE